MPQSKSPLLEKLGPFLERAGTEILNDPNNQALQAAVEAGSLATPLFKAELVAFSYAVLGLILASQRGRSACARAIQGDLGLTGTLVTASAGSPRVRLTRALSVVRRGDAERSVPPQGGIFEGSLFPHLVDPATGRLSLSEPLASDFVAIFFTLAQSLGPDAPSHRLLGELYEALLELEPEIVASPRGPNFRLSSAVREHARRQFGSYYTPDVLIEEVLDRALNPLIVRASEEAKKRGAHALLELRIVDPACGAGDFLHSAAKRLALALSEFEGRGQEREHESRQGHLATVLRHCIFGIDIDPLAVEICRLGLWLETSDVETELTPGSLPIRLGNAVVIHPPEEERPTPKRSEPPVLRYFDWAREFPAVMARGGFDVIVGNPPWIAHAGRASQSLPASLKAYYKRYAESFSGYPTTHGIFAGTLPRMLRSGGRLGLVLPTSVSELDGYAATRRAHDRFNTFPEELVDFGEGQFPGVTQPCMALVSERAELGRGPDAGTPWPVARPDLDPDERALLERIRSLGVLPPELFGERGLQSDRSLLPHLVKSSSPTGRFVVPIREGTDVREFLPLPPRFHADPIALGARLRSESEFRSVRILLRQTARFPIAALSDGLAFRNSILAGFELPEWPASALVPLFNSSFLRWAHFQRFRDARQPILPQVKIGHLRLLPAPTRRLQEAASELENLGSLAASSPGDRARVRMDIDALVFELYELTSRERTLVERWRDRVIN